MALAAPALSPVSAGTAASGDLARVCGRAPGIACRLVWDVSHSAHAADFTTVYLAGPVRLILRIGFVLLVAVVLRIAAGRLIRRLTARAAAASDPPATGDLVLAADATAADAAATDAATATDATATATATATDANATATATPANDLAPSRGTVSVGAPDVPGGDPGRRRVFGERRSQRATALASVLSNAASVTIFSVAGVIILGDLGLNLAPVLASAGVLGIAIGFGAQNLVKDFLAGVFMLLEDQYGVGDFVDIGDVAGTVEAVSLRITRLRDIHGVVWHIRNGTIKQAGNETHGWARAVVDFPVPYQLPVAVARVALDRAAASMWNDPAWRSVMLDRPQVWGVEDVSADTVLIRVAARTAPRGKTDVARALRERLKEALDAEAEDRSLALADPVPQLPEALEP